jgi:LDH2 family malate/lactate/ureidoglycolate dehydrogenase
MRAPRPPSYAWQAAKSWGHTIIAINPNGYVDAFEEKVASVCSTVKAAGPGVRLPGESSAAAAAKNTEAGTLPIPAKIWEKIQKTAAEGLPAVQ